MPNGKAIRIEGMMPTEFRTILTEEALEFLWGLDKDFGARRRHLLPRRIDLQRGI